MNRKLGDTFYFLFTTRKFASGVPGTLGGTPVISAYEDNSTTQITAGISLSADHDSVSGLNLVTCVATSGNGFEVAKDYNLVITTGTVDSVSVVGEVVGTFRLFTGDLEDVYSDTTVMEVTTSDTHSRLVVVESAIDSDQTSRATAISDVKSQLTLVESAIDSDQTSRTAAISDVKSLVVVVEAAIDSDQVSRATAISDVKSQLTVVESAIDSDQVSRTTAISDVKSQLTVVASDAAAIEGAYILFSGTADSGTTTTLVDAALTEADTDYWAGAHVVFTSGTIAGQVREITAFTPGTDTVAFSPATTQAVSTNTYFIVKGVASSGMSAAQDSKLTQVHSDVLAADIVSMASSVEAIEAAGGALTAAQDSKLTRVQSDVVQVYSDTTAIETKTSDTHSRLVVVETAIDSDQTSRTAAISDVHSLATKVYSDTTAIEAGGGALTAAQASQLLQAHSDIVAADIVSMASSVEAIEAAGGALTAAQDSKLTRVQSDVVEVYSDTTAIETKTSDTHSRLVVVETAIDSDQTSRATAISDVKSQLTVVESAIDSDQVSRTAAISDVKSELTKVYSDTTVIASDILAFDLLLLDTTVATVNSQTSFDLNAGSTNNNTYKDMMVEFNDVSDSNQPSIRQVVTYVAATNRITVNAAPDFTVVATDRIRIFAVPEQIARISSDTTAIETKTSDTHSRLVVVETAIDSDQTSRTAAISDVKSRLVVVESAIDSDQTSRTAAISDVHSRVVVVESSIDSDQTSRTAAISDVKSALTIAASDVALLFSAHAEPTGAPAANEAPVDKLAYVFATLRNKLTVTSSAKTFFDDAGASLWSKSISDDGSTYTEDEGA